MPAESLFACGIISAKDLPFMQVIFFWISTCNLLSWTYRFIPTSWTLNKFLNRKIMGH